MNRRGYLKKAVCIILMICVSMAFFYPGGKQTYTKAAAGGAVPVTGGLKKIVKKFTTPCGYTLVYEMHTGETKKFNFSKESGRKCIVSKQDKPLNSKQAGNLSKRLSGRRVSGAQAGGGNWGMAGPEITIKNITRVSLRQYILKADVWWIQSNGYNSDVIKYKTGSLKMILKKSPDSFYGYVVKSMTLKKLADV